MLTLLKISGFALIDEVEIAFGSGLTAVTGETGAGKSILVDALGLLRGARAGADLVRAGRDEARVEAIVELPAGSPARARLASDGREPGDADEGLVVRRIIARTGRGRAHLGGSLATAADLARGRGSADRHRVAARPAVADRSGQSARDPGRVRGERGAARRDGGRPLSGGRGGGGAGGVLGRRARPGRTRGHAPLSARRAGRGTAGGG